MRRGKHDKETARIRAILILVALCVLIPMVGSLMHRGGAPKDGGEAEVPEQEQPQEEGSYPDSGHLTAGLHGSRVTIVREGDPYVESGAFCFDDRTGPVTNCEIAGEVDTDAPGDYEVTYTFLGENAKAEVSRTVRVVPLEEFEGDTDGIPVLMYHWVYTADDVPEDLDANYILDTELEEQLAWLKENDYYNPSLAEIRAYADGLIDLPEKSVVLTFDDGRYNFLELGIPLLEKYEQPAISFLIGVNDGAEKIAEFASPYVDFQSHSYDMHHGGGTVGHGGIISAMTREEIEADLQQMIDMTGSAQGFAYPYGDVTWEAQQAITNKEILCAFTTEQKRIYVGSDPTAFGRVRIVGGNGLDGFIWSL